MIWRTFYSAAALIVIGLALTTSRTVAQQSSPDTKNNAPSKLFGIQLGMHAVEVIDAISKQKGITYDADNPAGGNSNRIVTLNFSGQSDHSKMTAAVATRFNATFTAKSAQGDYRAQLTFYMPTALADMLSRPQPGRDFGEWVRAGYNLNRLVYMNVFHLSIDPEESKEILKLEIGDRESSFGAPWQRWTFGTAGVHSIWYVIDGARPGIMTRMTGRADCPNFDDFKSRLDRDSQLGIPTTRESLAAPCTDLAIEVTDQGSTPLVFGPNGLEEREGTNLRIEMYNFETMRTLHNLELETSKAATTKK
jgi:hypothetical protein